MWAWNGSFGKLLEVEEGVETLRTHGDQDIKFIPLSVVCSVLGAHFKEIGSGSEPMWLLLLSAAPVISISCVVYTLERLLWGGITESCLEETSNYKRNMWLQDFQHEIIYVLTIFRSVERNHFSSLSMNLFGSWYVLSWKRIASECQTITDRKLMHSHPFYFQFDSIVVTEINWLISKNITILNVKHEDILDDLENLLYVYEHSDFPYCNCKDASKRSFVNEFYSFERMKIMWFDAYWCVRWSSFHCLNGDMCV